MQVLKLAQAAVSRGRRQLDVGVGVRRFARRRAGEELDGATGGQRIDAPKELARGVLGMMAVVD